MVCQYWLQLYHDADCAKSTIPDFVSIVYQSVLYLYLGSMDTQEFWHDGQLLAVSDH